MSDDTNIENDGTDQPIFALADGETEAVEAPAAPAPLFARGDKVVVNGGVLATIENYDVEADRVVFVTTPSGGGTDTTTAHISNTKLDKVE